jgi:protein-tyrosine phosphatase
VSFRVLFVCTGNVCRSPSAELLFRHAAAGAQVECASAGTSALVGRGVDGDTSRALAELGIDPGGHEAQRLTPGLVADADLLLTADIEHRAIIVRQAPEAFRRTFTLREFGRLGRDLPPVDANGPAPGDEQLRARVLAVAEQRGWVEAPEPGEDDIADPYRAGIEVARRSVADVVEAVDAAARVLGLVRREAT